MKYIVLISLLSLAGSTADKLFNDPVPDGVLPEIPIRTVAGTRAEAATEILVAVAMVCIYPYRQMTGVDAPAVDPKGYTVSNSDLIPAGTDGKAISSRPELLNSMPYRPTVRKPKSRLLMRLLPMDYPFWETVPVNPGHHRLH